MKREAIDIFIIEKRHHAVHARLLNWAEWAQCRGCQVRALANGPALFESARP